MSEIQPAAAMPAGWYPDTQGVTRFWDGKQWTDHIAPPPAPVAYQQPAYQQPMYQPMMVTTSRKQTNHTLHLLLTVFTLGAWAPVWICVALYNSMRHDKSRTRIG